MKNMNEMFWWHKIALPDGTVTPGTCTHGVTEDELRTRWGLPDNLKGKRILDIGAYDGLFSFACERRGAKSILAMDVYQNSPNTENPSEPFYYAKDKLKSNVDFKIGSVMDLNAWNGGQYELVLLYGVLYHLEEPLKGLEKACLVVAPSGKIIIETAVMNNDSDIPQLTAAFGYMGDKSNYYYPNFAWIKRELNRLGFPHVNQIFSMDGSNGRVTVTGER